MPRHRDVRGPRGRGKCSHKASKTPAQTCMKHSPERDTLPERSACCACKSADTTLNSEIYFPAPLAPQRGHGFAAGLCAALQKSLFGEEGERNSTGAWPPPEHGAAHGGT